MSQSHANRIKNMFHVQLFSISKNLQNTSNNLQAFSVNLNSILQWD